MKVKSIVSVILWSVVMFSYLGMKAQSPSKKIYFYGNEKNDLYLFLNQEKFVVQRYNSPSAAIAAASDGATVILLANDYPRLDSMNYLSGDLLNKVKDKNIRMYIEYPYAFEGLQIEGKPVETEFERGVVTSSVFGSRLPEMSLLGIHNAHIIPVKVDSPLIAMARVVGFDKAEYGLTDTKVYPVLFKKNNVLIAATALSNFKTARYGPRESITTLWTYILTWLTRSEISISSLPQDVKPAFQKNDPVSSTAKLQSIRKGTEWFTNGHFFVHPSWRQDWLKYGSNGLKPVGPPVSHDKLNGDGSLGILEGHTSTIRYDGTHTYRYWMRADVQGEVSMALAAAGRLLKNEEYRKKAGNLVDYLFETSNLRAGEKNNPESAVFGLIGWATTNAGSFYGDDNARAILGAIGASAYLKSDKWDKQIVEAIMANFRTTGINGFRGERLEEPDIMKNGWQYYHNRDIIYPSPHFESWMWACYLWLYNKTNYEPLLTRTKKAIRTMMEYYPGKWLWGSSMQTQRARMILPLAWLVQIENTAEHREWLDRMVAELLKYQDQTGAIREELGEGKGMFRELKKNTDYGTDEGSLIFKNGEKAACLLYTCNFALFSLNEAAQATANKNYKAAVDKLSDFITRVQVTSRQQKDLDGAWFRGFDYGRWDYWASNSDAGWGTWCTLTGWIQSWIVATQVQIYQKESFWKLTEKSAIENFASSVIKSMTNVTGDQK